MGLLILRSSLAYHPERLVKLISSRACMIMYTTRSLGTLLLVGSFLISCAYSSLIRVRLHSHSNGKFYREHRRKSTSNFPGYKFTRCKIRIKRACQTSIAMGASMTIRDVVSLSGAVLPMDLTLMLKVAEFLQ